MLKAITKKWFNVAYHLGVLMKVVTSTFVNAIFISGILFALTACETCSGCASTSTSIEKTGGIYIDKTERNKVPPKLQSK